MTTYKIQYSDQSMIDNHLKPYEIELSADTDNEINFKFFEWLSNMYDVTWTMFRLADRKAEETEVLMMGRKEPIGFVSFELIPD